MPREERHEWDVIFRTAAIAFATILVFALGARFVLQSLERLPIEHTEETIVPSPFVYSFNESGVLHETGSMAESSSPYWWLSSGGKLVISDGHGSTVRGRLGTLDRWRLLYARSNPEDTDDGYLPQNLFRLVSRSRWEDVRVEASFRILADNKTHSSNRNESNGLLLMTRYQDADNLYYAGIRVDGHAVIKKKQDGAYATLAESPVFPGAYDPETKENLLPHDEWIRLRTEVANEDEAVVIRLFMQRTKDDEWHPLLTARDTDNPIRAPGHVGIRTDFMDVAFNTIRIERL